MKKLHRLAFLALMGVFAAGQGNASAWTPAWSCSSVSLGFPPVYTDYFAFSNTGLPSPTPTCNDESAVLALCEEGCNAAGDGCTAIGVAIAECDLPNTLYCYCGRVDW